MFKENKDFFPTPLSLIRKMTAKINWKTVHSVLEPSGGKGDLIEAIYKQFEYTNSYRRTKKHDVDTIEIDNNLQAILKSKGYRLVHDNFLTYHTYKQYDLIIANFPFSECDKHLLHAINMIEQQNKTGQIVCIVNAETIKNPYSNIRKELAVKLNQYNASVEFLENAFSDSERKTNVNIALIHINIEKEANNSIILDELKQEELHNKKTEYENTSLIDSDFIRGIVAQYNHEIKVGLKLIEEYNKLKPFMLSSFNENSNPVLKLELDYRDDDSSSLENAYIKQIRAKYWKTLFTNEQFIGLFTSNLKQKYLQYVDELKDYDFSLFNIYTLRIQLSKEMIQGVEDTILNLFEEFSHKHYYDESSKNIHLFNGWKTNKAYKINKKVIIPLNAYDNWSNRYEPTSYRVLDKLKDIEKVFNYLDDGQTEEIDIKETLKLAQDYQDTKKIELKYFEISFFKKGTIHIEFKNMDLLKKFNLFGSQKKGFLPPSYGKTNYKDMSREEKEVIDSFEGEQSYNKVMNNRSYFIMNTEKLLMLA